ncbi:MAG: hypothetical protein F6K62_10700 [Sphaerospermopsis sp. SIO1G2]|nr:hypothetical protein [Sphaerospermopsis sp. SIO1G2]
MQLIEFVVGSKKPTQQPGGKRGLVRAKVYGKTPMQTFQEAKKLAAEKTIPAANASDSDTNLTVAA